MKSRLQVLARAALVMVFWQAADAVAQTGTELEEVLVRATRIEQSLQEISAAVSLVQQDDLQLGRQQLGLDEALARVPGMFFQNRYNFTQDLRISIRGFGSRANFGIRGLKLLVDGIPLTLADGQSGTDDVDMGSLQRVEVIRGPSSALYGTSSGGVINMYTEDGPDTPFVEAGVTVGEYDHQKYQAKAGGQAGALNYLVNASYLNNDGYRDYSEVNHSLLNSKFRYDIDESSDLTVVFNLVDSPVADDPGGITAADVEADPRQAQVRNTSSNAGESLEQQRLGWVYRREFGDLHEITLRNYYTWRDFQTFLPIGTHIPFSAIDGVVEFDRFFFGGGGQYSYSGDLFGRPNQFTAGFDIDVQEDDRQRFVNSAGVQGPMTFDQLEEAESYGIYFRDVLALSDVLTLTVGGRFDVVDLAVDDRFLANGDQSADIDFNEFSPSVGVSWNIWQDIYVYGNYSTAFETPTFTELGSPAQDLDVNLGGFANIKAQQTDGFEFGLRGRLWDRADIDIAVFKMEVDDEVSNVVSIGNRAFFENADTDRFGFEAGMIIDLMEGLRLTAAYTYSDFEFENFPSNTAVEGNDLPGLPENQFYAELNYTHPSGFYVSWDILAVDNLYLDNGNTARTDAYEVSNLRLGYAFTVNNIAVSPFVGLNNLFDESYIGNVRINSFGGRALEAAPDFNAYGGVTARYSY